MLLHLEPSQPLGVKVFDTAHKLIAAREHPCNEFNVNMLKTSYFKGLFEIDGDAVLFIQQEHLNKERLIRVRIDGTNGKLVDEEIMGQSRSLARPTQFYVMPDKANNEYAILFSSDVPQFKECDVHINYYDSKHTLKKTVTLDVDRKKYDYMSVLNADILPNGACVTLAFSEIIINGTTSSIGRDPKSTSYNHYAAIYYVPRNEDSAYRRSIDLTPDFYPYYSIYSYNSFDKAIDLLLLSYKDVILRNGLELLPAAETGVLFLRLNQSLEISHNWLNNKMASDLLKAKRGPNNSYVGLPTKVFPSSTGLSTVMFESHDRYRTVETNARNNVHETYFGNMCLTQCTDQGEETWTTVLPKEQYYMSYQHYYPATDIGKRWQDQVLFADLPAQVYNRQFISCNAYKSAGNFYVIYNDLKENFDKALNIKTDTVFTHDKSNAVCYKIGHNKETVKYNLFGDAPEPEYKASFIEGADFDEQRGVYATLVQLTRRDYKALRMAWCKLD
jgi:hypothetical protein